MITKPKLVKEFHAQFTDPGTHNKYNITSDSLETLQKDVKHILGSNVQFEANTERNAYVIELREQPVGWFSLYEVPEAMSVRNISNIVTNVLKAA